MGRLPSPASRVSVLQRKHRRTRIRRSDFHLTVKAYSELNDGWIQLVYNSSPPFAGFLFSICGVVIYRIGRGHHTDHLPLVIKYWSKKHHLILCIVSGDGHPSLGFLDFIEEHIITGDHTLGHHVHLSVRMTDNPDIRSYISWLTKSHRS